MNMKLCTKLVLLVAVQGSVALAGADDLPITDSSFQNPQIRSPSGKPPSFALQVRTAPDCINYPGPRPIPPPGNIKGGEEPNNK